jgi:hypothetical protein
MDSIRHLTQRDACFPEDAEAAASHGTTSTTGKKGDTPAPGLKERKANLLEEFVCRFPMTPGFPAPRSAGEGGTFTAGALATLGAPASQPATFLRTNGVPFQTSPDGTPKYKQGDTETGGNWGAQLLGNAAETPRTIASKGCAMTSVAMALSKLSGETITPAVLDAFLDAQKGYVGNAIKWGTAGQVTSSPITVTKQTAWNVDTVNAELAAGRPVVLGVDYKDGKSGGTQGTDHWVCLTRQDPSNTNRYFANDPITGTEISFLRQPDGRLVEEKNPGLKREEYRSSGEFVTFRA